MVERGSLTVQRWRTAELAGRAEEGDRLFRELMSEVARATAPGGFTGRVADTLGWARRPPARVTLAGRLRRLATVAALGVVGLAFVVYGTVSLAPLIAAQLLDLLNFSVRGFVWLVRAVDNGLGAWTILGRAGRAIGSAIATPRVTVGFVAVEMIGVAALYALHRMLRLEKETTRW